MLTTEELEDALSLGYEGRGFEFKGPGDCGDKYFLAKVARAALSMGNLRDGGYVVIGIDDSSPERMLPGLNDDQLNSWLAYDDVAARLSAYCDPPVQLDIASFTFSSGASVIVLQVHEFGDIPHLCAREYPDVLRRGALYVRSRKLPETSEVASSVEMREVLDLAAEKRLRAFVEMAERAGARIVSDIESDEEKGAADRQRFDAQRDEAWE